MSIGAGRRRHSAIALGVIALVSALFAGAGALFAADHTIEIRGFEFVPDRLTVETGDRITWINRDIVPHTATASDQTWDTKRLKKDEAVTIVVTEGMEAAYFCRFHPNMKAALVVRTNQ